MPPSKRRRTTPQPDHGEFTDALKVIEDEFYLKLPSGVLDVARLALEISAEKPLQAFKKLDIELAGPFYVLFGKPKSNTSLPWCLQNRHRFDPPEVVTVATSLKNPTLHFGIHRDAPNEVAAMVVSNDSKVSGKFSIHEGGLADAFLDHAKSNKPDKTVTRKLEKLAKSEQSTFMSRKDFKRREIDTTLSGLGIAVPYDKTTEVGWRPLECSDKELQKYIDSLLKAKEAGTTPDFTRLDKLITFANIANDECDYGQALKLGLDLYSTDPAFDDDAASLLSSTYKLLDRAEFATVVDEATKDERRRMVI